jgi:predicted metal-dependent hydrolase
MQTEQMPEFSIRHSPRSKRLKIRVVHDGTVEVVVPPGYDLNKIPSFVQKHQAWIEKIQKRIVVTRQTLSPETMAAMPEQIKLRACDETWQVQYQSIERSTLQLIITPYTLTLTGPIDREDLCYQLLRNWIRQKAKRLLVPWLAQLSQETQLSYQKVKIRTYKTVWGSCSSKKFISLNDKLLFLPAERVRYVLIHELCHTIHLNHSPEFWALVAAKSATYRSLDRGLREAWAYVPPWMN